MTVLNTCSEQLHDNIYSPHSAQVNSMVSQTLVHGILCYVTCCLAFLTCILHVTVRLLSLPGVHTLTLQAPSLGWHAFHCCVHIVCLFVLQLFLGDTNRTISETPMNMASSRSHCVFTIYIEARQVNSFVTRPSCALLLTLPLIPPMTVLFNLAATVSDCAAVDSSALTSTLMHLYSIRAPRKNKGRLHARNADCLEYIHADDRLHARDPDSFEYIHADDSLHARDPDSLEHIHAVDSLTCSLHACKLGDHTNQFHPSTSAFAPVRHC